MTSGSNRQRFKAPPDSYEMDNLMFAIAQKIRPEELETLKHCFPVTRDVATPKEMLDCLRDQGFIDRYNISYVQQIAYVLEREDILQILNIYVELFEKGKVLHIERKMIKIAEGCTLVQFHILGHGPLDMKELEDLRLGIARLLLCPLDQVIVKGIHATNSILLSIMIPTMYANFVGKQLENHNQRIIKSFLQMDIDKVIFDNNEFLLQKEGDIYKVKKMTIKQMSAKHVSSVSRATKAGEENAEKSNPRSLIIDKCQSHQTKRSSPVNVVGTKRRCPENAVGTKTPRLDNGIITRSLTRSSSPATKILNIFVVPVE